MDCSHSDWREMVPHCGFDLHFFPFLFKYCSKLKSGIIHQNYNSSRFYNCPWVYLFRGSLFIHTASIHCLVFFFIFNIMNSLLLHLLQGHLVVLSCFSRIRLCYPIDGSPPGSPVLGNLQARILEQVAISFSNAWKWKVKVKSLSRVQLLATPWTAAYQAPPSMGFSRQEYWSRLPLPSQLLIRTHLNQF